MCLDDVHTTTFYICLMILHEWFHFLIDKQTKNLRNGFCTTFWIYNSFGNIWLHHMHLEFPNKIWSENIFLLMFDRVFQLRNWETQIKFAFYDDKTFFVTEKIQLQNQLYQWNKHHYLQSLKSKKCSSSTYSTSQYFTTNINISIQNVYIIYYII